MLLFRLKRTIELGAKSLWMHRLRSSLTILGVVFGVCSVIAMLAIGEGASRQAQEDIAKLGSRNIIIETVKPPEQQKDSGNVEKVRNYGLTYDDADSIRNTLKSAEVTVPVRIISQESRYNSRKVAVNVLGTVPWYEDVSSIKIIDGRFLSAIDLKHQLAVCVVDEQVARKLFTFDDPIGLDVKIQGYYYRVVGITSQSVDSGMTDVFSDSEAVSGSNGGVIGNIYVPITTAKCRFSEFSFQMSGNSRNAERVELQKIIIKVGSNEEVLPTRDVLDSLLSRLHKKQDYRIVVPLELLRQAAQTRRIFSIVLGSIAAISLLVGGIGIMNIMLATVSERTREIGIRRAIGARKWDIIIQFLSETLMLTLVGGILGIVLGTFIPFLVTHFGHMPTVITPISLILAFGISVGIGIIFGLYPACRAANMDPIKSLRHE